MEPFLQSSIPELIHLPDLQDRPLQSLRPQMHYSGDRKYWRTPSNLPAGGGVAALTVQPQDGGMRHG